MNTLIGKIKEKSFLNNLYYLAFTIQVSVFFLRSTLIGDDHLGRVNIIFGRTCTLLVFISIIMILIKIIIESNSGIDFKILSLIIFILVSYIYLKTNYLEVMSTTTLMLGSRKTNYFHLAKIFFRIGIFLTIITVILSLLNVIVNIDFYKNGMNTYAAGFVYPTDFASHIFTIFLSYYVYKIQDDFSYWSILILFLTTILIYKITYAKNDFICMIILLFFVIVYKIIKYINLTNKEHTNNFLNKFIVYINIFYNSVLLRLASFSLLIISFISIFFAYIFSNSSYILLKLNEVLTGRLFLSNEALHLYPINLLGHKVVEHGFGGVNGVENSSHYFFIDQSIIRIFVLYGGIVSTLFILGYTLKMNKLIKHRYSFLLILFAVFSLYCFIDFRIYDPSYNVFIPILFSTLPYNHALKNNKKSKEFYNEIFSSRIRTIWSHLRSRSSQKG